MQSSDVVIQVSNETIRQAIVSAVEFLEQARYKQAIGSLSTLLNHQGLSLVEKILVLGQRAWIYTHWKKDEKAIRDCNKILKLAQADLSQLDPHGIDWEKEKAEDIGHLQFLGQVYHLRGILKLRTENYRGAVEDLTMAIFMTQAPEANHLNHLHRAEALMHLNDCLEQAVVDLNQALTLAPEQAAAYLDLSESGTFEKQNDTITFQGQELTSTNLLDAREKNFPEGLNFQTLTDCYYKE